MSRDNRINLLQGTLDLLILRSLLFGEAHGHALGTHIRRTSEDTLHVETGSLYPALHRLEKQSLIASRWETSDRGKRAKYYRLTLKGRRQLVKEESKWQQLSRAIGQVLASLSWSGHES